MNYSELKEIIEDMQKSKLAEMAIEFPDGTKISLKNKEEGIRNYKEVIEEKIEKKEGNTEENNKTQNEEGLKIVTSPMVGTFYAKSSPTAEPFVEVGKKVKKGDILCIIEAMKLMNEIESEYDGEIAEILIKDGEMCDYGKPLFKIR